MPLFLLCRLEDPHITPCCIKSFCLKHFSPSSSTSVSCPSCKKKFSFDNLIPDNCRKKDSENERAKLNVLNPPLSQKSQSFAEFYQPQNVAMQINTVGKKSHHNQNFQSVFSENIQNVEEQTHNSLHNFHDTNRNFGGQSTNSLLTFTSYRYRNDQNLLSDTGLCREMLCSECLNKADCIHCQHCELYFCSQCHNKHILDMEDIHNLKAAEKRLNDLISDLLSRKETEAFRRSDKMEHILTARNAISENFANALKQIEDLKTRLLKLTSEKRSEIKRIQESLRNDQWIMDMLNKGDVKYFIFNVYLNVKMPHHCIFIHSI